MEEDIASEIEDAINMLINSDEYRTDIYSVRRLGTFLQIETREATFSFRVEEGK